MTDSTSTWLKPLPHNKSNNHRHGHVYGNYELNTYEISSNVKCFFSHLVPHVEFFSLLWRISQKRFQIDFHENGKVPTTRLGSLPCLHKCIYINQSVVTISQQKSFASKWKVMRRKIRMILHTVCTSTLLIGNAQRIQFCKAVGWSHMSNCVHAHLILKSCIRCTDNAYGPSPGFTGWDSTKHRHIHVHL